MENTTEVEEDFLSVDHKVPGQNFVCLSFISPEKVLKKKEVYILHEFLKSVCEEYNIEHKDICEKFEDFKYKNEADLTEKFTEDNDFQTNVRGVKVRGVYDTKREADVRAKVLQRQDKHHNVFVGQVGYWLPWDPSTEDIKDQEYQEDQLNQLMKKYNENADEKEEFYEQEKQEKIRKAREENRKKNKTDKSEFELNQPEDKDKIEKMRTIVDSSRGYTTNKDDVEDVTKEFTKLTDEDPWLQRQKSTTGEQEKKVMTIE